MARSRFIGAEVAVDWPDKLGPPVSFVWEGREYRIVEVLSARRKLDFKKAWWRRRHRDYYLVRTDTGQVFELYLHRGPGKRYWVLYEELDAADPP